VAIRYGSFSSPVPPLYLAYEGKLREKIVIAKKIVRQSREILAEVMR